MQNPQISNKREVKTSGQNRTSFNKIMMKTYNKIPLDKYNSKQLFFGFVGYLKRKIINIEVCILKAKNPQHYDQNVKRLLPTVVSMFSRRYRGPQSTRGTYLTLKAYLKRQAGRGRRHVLQYRAYLSTNGLHVKGEQLHPNAESRISFSHMRIDDDLLSYLIFMIPCEHTIHYISSKQIEHRHSQL